MAPSPSRWPLLAPDPPPGLRPAATPPTLAVVITAHQVAAYLPETLTSVFASRTQPDEVVVVDDGSTDDVAAAVRPWAARVQLVRRAQGGEGAAKNTGTRAATADVVVNLDGDDTMSPDRLTAVAEVLQARPDLDLLTSEFDQFGPGAPAEPYRFADRFPVSDQRGEVLRWNFLPAPAVRRAPLLAAGGYAEDLAYGPDWECWARMLLAGSRAGLVTEPHYRYRRWGGQQTADRRRVLRGRVAVLQALGRGPGLGPQDRAVLARSLARARADALRWSLRHDPAAGRGPARDARPLLLAPGLGLRARGLAAATALSPGLVRAGLRRRAGGAT